MAREYIENDVNRHKRKRNTKCYILGTITFCILLVWWFAGKRTGLKLSEDSLGLVNEKMSDLAEYSFSELAWWSEAYKGGFPKDKVDQASWWRKQSFTEVISGVAPVCKKGGDNEVVVALLDTGFSIECVSKEYLLSINSEELVKKNKEAGYRISDDFIGISVRKDYSSCVDRSFLNLHGTLILNLLVGEKEDYKGLLCGQKVKVLLVRVLDDEGKGTTDHLIEAIKCAEQNGADICSASLTFHYNDKELLAAMKESKMLFVVPAGNEGWELGEAVSYPTMFSLENTISVAALRIDGNLSDKSNYSSAYVDIAAPGSDIVVLNGEGEMLLMSGTSLAVPFVVWAAVMIKGSNKDASAKEMKELIIRNATKTEKLQPYVRSGGYVTLK